MSSHIHMSGNPSSQQAQPPEQTPEQQLFEEIAKACMPYYGKINDIHDNSSFLIGNLRGQYDVLRDSASTVNSCCKGGDVIEMCSESLIGFYDGILSQINIIDVLNDFQMSQYLSIKHEKEQLQKRLLSMERDLCEAIETNVEYYAQIQGLKMKLSTGVSIKEKATS